ncbi:MAG: PorV/PorQ family protein [Candidatus Zixiibacteriota bacterium]|nr:MAG: PorV/PorQ family protein [candidate division Zixibacteria bacterium]
MMRAYKYALILFLVISGSASAQVSQTAVQFLLIAPGARAGGMGETFVAISDDATAVHWNPAGLGRYPLTGSWLNLKAAEGDTLREVVLVKNNLPEVNYKQYDIWGVVNGRLSRWENGKWIAGMQHTLRKESSLESMILRYTGLEESDAQVYIDRLARANNEITPESIDSLESFLVAILPEDYIYREDIQFGFEKLHRTYLRLRINVSGFNEIKSDIETVAAQSPPSEDLLNQIAFGFDRAISPKGDRSVWLPYDLILPDTITCLASDDDYVYVGTKKGFFRLDPGKFRWSSFAAEGDSLPSNNITAIEKTGRRKMFIGTDKGVFVFSGRNLEPFGEEAGAPTGYISAIAANKDRDVWAVSNGLLYHYDGVKWLSSKVEEISIGEDLTLTAKKYYGKFGDTWHESLMEKITTTNAGRLDSVEAGQSILLPYESGYKGEVTELSVDSKGNLWIGTSLGLVLLSENGFSQFGYRLVEVPEGGLSLDDMAAQFIPDRDPVKIETLKSLIKEYNDLKSEQLSGGDRILVNANPLASRINAVTQISNKKAIVATTYGTFKYNSGEWSRLYNLGDAGTRVVNIYERGGEMWFASDDRVTVYAAAKKHITFMHSNYLVQLADDLYYDYFSIVYPTSEWGTFGFGVTFLSYGSQERTSEIGDALGSFVSYDLAFTLSYGTRIARNISGGLSLRYINSHLAEAGAGAEKGKGTGYSLAVDVGVMYNLTRRLTLATNVSNLGPDIAYIDADQADPLPRKLAFGFNYKLVDSPFNKIYILGEADKLLVDMNDDITTEIEEVIPHLGIEYWYSNYVGLRSGYVYDDKGVQKYFTLGASLQYSNYRFDFSYIPSTDEKYNRLGNTMRFSMNVGF